MGAVLGCQVDRHQSTMPVIGNEDTVIPIGASIQVEYEGSLQGSHIQQSEAVLQQCDRPKGKRRCATDHEHSVTMKTQSSPYVPPSRLSMRGACRAATFSRAKRYCSAEKDLQNQNIAAWSINTEREHNAAYHIASACLQLFNASLVKCGLTAVAVRTESLLELLGCLTA